MYFNILVYAKTIDYIIFKSREPLLGIFTGSGSGPLYKGLPAPINLLYQIRLRLPLKRLGSQLPALAPQHWT